MTDGISFNVVYCSLEAFERLRGIVTDNGTLTKATLFGVPVHVRPTLSGLRIILANETERGLEIVKVVELPEKAHTYIVTNMF